MTTSGHFADTQSCTTGTGAAPCEKGRGKKAHHLSGSRQMFNHDKSNLQTAGNLPREPTYTTSTTAATCPREFNQIRHKRDRRKSPSLPVDARATTVTFDVSDRPESCQCSERSNIRTFYSTVGLPGQPNDKVPHGSTCSASFTSAYPSHVVTPIPPACITEQCLYKSPITTSHKLQSILNARNRERNGHCTLREPLIHPHLRVQAKQNTTQLTAKSRTSDKVHSPAQWGKTLKLCFRLR